MVPQFILSARLAGGRRGRPCVTMELKEVGLDVGQWRDGRLMKINGLYITRRRHSYPGGISLLAFEVKAAQWDG